MNTIRISGGFFRQIQDTIDLLHEDQFPLAFRYVDSYINRLCEIIIKKKITFAELNREHKLSKVSNHALANYVGDNVDVIIIAE